MAAKGAKQTVSSLHKAFASSIVDTYNPNAGPLARLYSRILTSFYLSQLKGSFLEFSKTEFPNTASTIYRKLLEGVKKNDRVTLNEILTLPNYDLFKTCLKNNKQLPYLLCPQLESAKIVHCRLTSEKGNQVESETFVHITVALNCKSDTGRPKILLGIYERRMDNKAPYAWKIAFIEEEDED